MQYSLPNIGYLTFIAEQKRFLAFGFLMAFVSSAGQTFFIGAFGPSIRAEFDISHGTWGGIYMLGTLMSAAFLPWTGQLFDRMTLPRFAGVVALALVIASTFMSNVPNVVLLVFAIFLLRQSGQGLASHIASTSMAYRYRKNRGKAIAIALLGFSAGEALLPLLAVMAIAAYGWRATYSGVAVILAIFLPPLLWYLLRERPARKSDALEEHTGSPEVASWTRRQVLRHGPFYLVLPAVLTPSFIDTALFFHHLPLAEAKGWSAAWITGNYWVFAVGTVFASIVFGPLIDRFSALRLLSVLLAPMTLAMVVLWQFTHPFWAMPYLLFLGVGTGITFTVVTALWAELYGPAHLGAIRSLTAALSVFASALGPPVMGFLMDWGFTVETICAFFALYCVMASVLLYFGIKHYRRPRLLSNPA